jgi:hypothetical protein
MTARDWEDELTGKLRAHHGGGRRVDTGAALRLIGKRDEVHPRDAIAFAYRDHAAARAYASANLELYGHPSLGTGIGGDEIIVVHDLRPSFTTHCLGVTAPGHPDDWPPPVQNDGPDPRCGRCLDTGQVCEDHPYIAQESCGDAGCGTIGIPCPACCTPVPADGTHSITEAFTPDWLRS